MRGHYAVGFRQVVRRERRVEGSAWLARLGAPARRFRRASLCGFSLCPLTGTAIFAALNGSPLLFSSEKGEEGRKQCVVGALGRARAPIPPRVPVCKSHSSLYCTAIFAVLNGSPLQSVHALPSTFFSLLSTYRTLTHSLSLASLSIITLRILTMSMVSFGGMGTIRSLKNLRMTSTWFSK